MVLLDTDICIYLLNQHPGFEAILRRLDGRRQGEVALSAITLAELRFGIAASQRRAVNLAKLESWSCSSRPLKSPPSTRPPLPPTARCARIYRHEVRRLGLWIR